MPVAAVVGGLVVVVGPPCVVVVDDDVGFAVVVDGDGAAVVVETLGPAVVLSLKPGKVEGRAVVLVVGVPGTVAFCQLGVQMFRTGAQHDLPATQ